MKRTFVLSLFSSLVSAIHLSVTRINAASGSPPSSDAPASTKLKFSNLAAARNVTTNKDLLYIADITIGGTDYPVQLDTGSSDIWVGSQDTIPGVTHSTTTFNLTYGTGWAYGLISRANISFGGITIPDQAFLDVTEADNPVYTFGAVGLVGLGFTSLSHIDDQVNKAEKADWGRSFLYNAFAQNKSTPNYIAFALQRSLNPDDDVTGSFTIGEVVPQYASVLSTNHIPTWPVDNPTRWNVLVDNFIVSGTQFNVNSTVKNVSSGKAVALLDTGSSYSFVPPYVANAIYSNVRGATFNSQTRQWVVPCDSALLVTLTIGGRQFDLHPLDLVQNSLANPKQCIGTFLPQSLSVGGGEFDWLLGDNTLRSVYSVYDFGDWETSGAMGRPYVQLLSTVNITDAIEDFKAVRGGNASLQAAGSGNGADNSSSPDVTSSLKQLLSYTPILFALVGLNALFLLGIIGGVIFYCCRRKKQKRAKTTKPERQRDAHTLSTMPTLKSNAPSSSRSHAYQAVPVDNANEDGPRYDTRPPRPTRALPAPAAGTPAAAPEAPETRVAVTPQPLAPVVARTRMNDGSTPMSRGPRPMSTATSQRPLSSVTSKSEAESEYGDPTKYDDYESMPTPV